jgi:hypothetical protein
MIDCTVCGNVSDSVPGAGILIGSGSAVRLTGCTIEENYANRSWGGGLFNNNGQGTLSNCLIRKYRAATGGGIMNLGGALTLRQTQVTANESFYPGSGINSLAGTVSLEESGTICANDPWETRCKGFDDGGACTEICPGP